MRLEATVHKRGVLLFATKQAAEAARDRLQAIEEPDVTWRVVEKRGQIVVAAFLAETSSTSFRGSPATSSARRCIPRQERRISARP
jgi:hypothetical protein